MHPRKSPTPTRDIHSYIVPFPGAENLPAATSIHGQTGIIRAAVRLAEIRVKEGGSLPIPSYALRIQSDAAGILPTGWEGHTCMMDLNTNLRMLLKPGIMKSGPPGEGFRRVDSRAAH